MFFITRRPPPSEPPDPPLPTYYVDPSIGIDSNDGLTPATPWATWDKAQGFVYPESEVAVNLKAGSVFNDTMSVPLKVKRVDTYGGAAKATFTLCQNIKGTTSDWTQDGTNPVAWSRTITSNNTSKDWVLFNGGALNKFNRKMGSVALITAVGDYARLTTTTAHVYSVGNPATEYNTIENIVYNVSEPPGIFIGGTHTGCTVRNIISKGQAVGLTCGANNTIEDCEIWFTSNKGILLSGAHNTTLLNTPSYFTGTTAGGNGIFVAQITRVGSDPVTCITEIIDSPNYGAFEDNYQMVADTTPHVDDNYVCRMIATAPKSMWFTGNRENTLDIKGGLIELIGPGTCDSGVQGTTSFQGFSRGLKNRGWSLRETRSGVTCVQMQELNFNKFDSEKSFYYAESANAMNSTQNGQPHTSVGDVFWGCANGTLAVVSIASGSLSALHSSFIGIGTTSTGVEFKTGNMTTGIDSLVHDGVDDGTGHYTATISENITDVPNFSDGGLFRLSGMSGTSAAYHGLYTMSNCTCSAVGQHTTASFPVPIASSPPATANLTGIVMTRYGVIGTMQNNLLSSATIPLEVQAADCLPVLATGANYVSEWSAGINRLVEYLPATYYTAAQVISNTAAAGNLRHDTGIKLGGSTWVAEEASGSTPTIIYDTAATISVTNKVATVTSSVIVPTAVGQPVGITGSSNVGMHGIHFVKSIGSGFFTFDAEYDDPDFTAITCTTTQFRPKTTSAGYQTSPTISLDITTDVLSQEIPATGRHYGAVMGG